LEGNQNNRRKESNLINSGLAWLHFVAPSISRAAQFRPLWRQTICFSGYRWSCASTSREICGELLPFPTCFYSPNGKI